MFFRQIQAQVDKIYKKYHSEQKGRNAKKEEFEREEATRKEEGQ